MESRLDGVARWRTEWRQHLLAEVPAHVLARHDELHARVERGEALTPEEETELQNLEPTLMAAAQRVVEGLLHQGPAGYELLRRVGHAPAEPQPSAQQVDAYLDQMKARAAQLLEQQRAAPKTQKEAENQGDRARAGQGTTRRKRPERGEQPGAAAPRPR
ncbi:MAG: hypothetical protein HY690_18110 [Chloroflexi bacterium]|nr:hypothetical protein [Chloroflexota bacterium]